MNSKTNVRAFARRDSATAALKKLGIKREDYDKIITVDADGKHSIDADVVAKFVNSNGAQPAGNSEPPFDPDPPAKPEPAAKPASAKADKPPKKQSVAQLCLTLFKAGKSNKEVWSVLQTDRRLGEGKEHYPAWYRGYFRRTGKLPRPAAKAKAKKS